MEQILLAVDFLFVAVEYVFGFLNEVVHKLEFLLKAGEPQVGDLVQLSKPQGDGIAEVRAWDFAVEVAEDFFLDLVDEAFQGLDADRTLPARPLQTAKKFFVLERGPTAVLLDHQQAVGFLDSLVGRKSFAAGLAEPAASDDSTTFRGPGVHYLVRSLLFAKGALHLIAILREGARTPNM
jgi:hypothetical protein